jgi:hypothetical protein
VAIIRLIFAVGVLAATLGFVFELASSRVVDIAAGVCAVATWIAPLLMSAVSAYRPPRTSLGRVGASISLIVFAAMFSVAGISLALLTLLFAQGGRWAWPALMAIAAFWLSGAALLAVASRRSKRPEEGGS